MNEQGSMPTHILTWAHAIVHASPAPDELDATLELELATLEEDAVEDADELAFEEEDAAVPPPAPDAEDAFSLLTLLPHATMATAVHTGTSAMIA